MLYYGAAAGRGGVGEDIAVLDTGYYLSQVELQKSLTKIYKNLNPIAAAPTSFDKSQLQIGLSLVMGRLVEMTGLPHYYIIGTFSFSCLIQILMFEYLQFHALLVLLQ